MLRRFAILTVFILFALCVNAQTATAPQEDSLALQQIPSNYLDKVSSKAEQLEQKLDKKSEKALQQMMKLEEKIKRKMSVADSSKVKEIFGDAQQKYKDLEQRLQGALSKPYMASLDTMLTSLKFLQQNPQLISKTKEYRQKLKDAINKVAGMEGKFQKAEKIKVWLRERKEFLKRELSKFGFAKELKKISKTSFYYAQYLSEAKEILKDHRKAEKKAIELLSRTTLFKNFMQKNSQLASLFRLSVDPNDPIYAANLAGLQTRAQVNQMIQSQISAGGPNAQQQLQKNLQQAQSVLNKLKEKMNELGGGGSDDEIPDFKINHQRSKSFWKKWELSVTAQSNKPNNFFPVTTDLSMLAGFRPHDKYIMGIGIGGLIGWGRDIRHIEISSQGLSIKSFAEIELKKKGSLHFIAGYEMHYRSEIKNIEQLKDKSVWQYSALAGISKVVAVKSKFFKKAKVQWLWDALAYRSVPRQPAVVFRIGYAFR